MKAFRDVALVAVAAVFVSYCAICAVLNCGGVAPEAGGGDASSDAALPAADATTDATINDAAPPSEDAFAPSPEAAAPSCAPLSPAFVHGAPVCYVAGGDSRTAFSYGSPTYAQVVSAMLGNIVFVDVGVGGITAAQVSGDFSKDRAGIASCFEAGAPVVVYSTMIGVNDLLPAVPHDAAATGDDVASILAQAKDAGALVTIALEDPGSYELAPSLLAAYRQAERAAGADVVASLCLDEWDRAVNEKDGATIDHDWTIDGVHGRPAFEACEARDLYPLLLQAFVAAGAIPWDGGTP